MKPGTYNTAVVALALRQHQRQLRAFVRARVPLDEVNDVLQSAAVRAIEKAASLHDPARVLAWLYRLHRNVITDLLRQRASQRRLLAALATLPETPTPTESKPLCPCSVHQVNHITASYALILTLVDMGNASLKEAAQVLGVSINNATVRLHRARKALKQRLYDHCGVKRLADCTDCRCVDNSCGVA